MCEQCEHVVGIAKLLLEEGESPQCMKYLIEGGLEYGHALWVMARATREMTGYSPYVNAAVCYLMSTGGKHQGMPFELAKEEKIAAYFGYLLLSNGEAKTSTIALAMLAGRQHLPSEQ